MKRVSGEEDSVILAEIRKLRNEHTEAANDTKEALTRLDHVLKDMVERTALLEQRMVNTEERLGDTEDRMLHQEAKLAAKCDDSESRSRRNNVRIHGIPEGCEKNDTIGFISGFIRSSLQIPAEVDMRIERAHRSLLAKPKENTAPPRAIIVRFLDYRVTEQVIQQAWKQKTTYEGRTIYFNQHYTNEVQKKRKQVRDVIKKLKDKKVKAQSPYPAQLKVFDIHYINGGCAYAEGHGDPCTGGGEGRTTEAENAKQLDNGDETEGEEESASHHRARPTGRHRINSRS
ncbi:hypothetical protein KUCAC02_031334 [Chaenocephalus aceratus]|uniref:Uncharacterized protein n=1 Tax=Chaenocephalus aceratus TaxID=36190 RepID=A0ACB9XM81_CHAAC|nr:hypothetical protein KUCAC02_031334 [Chaenocephalus aceratus]